jgi:hypothetical protein
MAATGNSPVVQACSAPQEPLFTRLDDSLVQDCLSLLPAPDLLRAAASCKALNRLSKGENSVWRKLCARRGLTCAIDPNFEVPQGKVHWSELYRRLERINPVGWSQSLVQSWAELNRTISAIEDHPVIAMSLEEGFQVFISSLDTGPPPFPGTPGPHESCCAARGAAVSGAQHKWEAFD